MGTGDMFRQAATILLLALLLLVLMPDVAMAVDRGNGDYVLYSCITIVMIMLVMFAVCRTSHR